MASNEAVPLTGVAPGVSAEPAYRFLSPHQAAVLDAASRHLNPDPHVAVYVDRLLSVFHVEPGGAHSPGPLRQRVTELRRQYCSGIALLDELAGGDFTAAPPLSQQLILSHARVAPFASLLFDQLTEARIGRDTETSVTTRRATSPRFTFRRRPAVSRP